MDIRPLEYTSASACAPQRDVLRERPVEECRVVMPILRYETDDVWARQCASGHIVAAGKRAKQFPLA